MGFAGMGGNKDEELVNESEAWSFGIVEGMESRALMNGTGDDMPDEVISDAIPGRSLYRGERGGSGNRSCKTVIPSSKLSRSGRYNLAINSVSVEQRIAMDRTQILAFSHNTSNGTFPNPLVEDTFVLL